MSIGSNGLFKVSGYYEADIEKITCTCPDYKNRKEACKHLSAAMLFVKNRGKDKIGHLEGFNGNGNGRKDKESVKEPSDNPKEANSKPFDRQSTIITRLAVLNTATEILKTHRKPIEFCDIVSLAAQLENWALGS
ncbi:MAG: SWIM zinc finger family protein [Ignavibacteriales bacterium]